MIDTDLARRALVFQPPSPPPPPAYPRMALATPSVRVHATEADALATVSGLTALNIAWIGLDTEYRAQTRPDGSTGDNDWRDPSRCRPVSVGLAVFARAEGGVLVVHRAAFDVRTPATHSALAQLLALPVLFVTHNFRAEYFTLATLGLPFPAMFFCTWLGAKQLMLGRLHARYEVPEPEDEAEEIRADKMAATQRESAVSLLGLLRRYGLPHRFPGDKAAMQARYSALLDEESLDARDAAYVTADAEATGALYPRVHAELARYDLLRHYELIELPGALAFARMQWRGVRVDEEARESARLAALRAVAQAETVLEPYGFPAASSPRRRILANSRPAVLQALAKQRVPGVGRLLDLFRSSKTTNGYSITRERLREFREVHPLLEALYRHRRYSAVVSDKLFQGGLVGADGNVHCEIDPLGADTGRPVYKRPNLVGIGRDFRPMIVPDRLGYGLAELDFVAEEIFIAAVIHGDEELLRDVNRGDPYRRVAGWLFARDLHPGHEQLTDGEFAEHARYKTLRKRAKVIALGIIYGMGDHSIAAKLQVSVPRAGQLRARFFERYIGLAAGIGRAIRALEERGYAETVTGLKRFRGASGPLSPWERRWAVNTPVQGSAAGLLKILLPRLDVALAPLETHVVLAPYDAVLLQYPLDERRTVALTTGAALMASTFRELFPGTEPRIDVNHEHPHCWNDDGRADSIDRFLAELEAYA